MQAVAPAATKGEAGTETATPVSTDDGQRKKGRAHPDGSAGSHEFVVDQVGRKRAEDLDARHGGRERRRKDVAHGRRAGADEDQPGLRGVEARPARREGR